MGRKRAKVVKKVVLEKTQVVILKTWWVEVGATWW